MISSNILAHLSPSLDATQEKRVFTAQFLISGLSSPEIFTRLSRHRRNSPSLSDIFHRRDMEAREVLTLKLENAYDSQASMSFLGPDDDCDERKGR